MLLEEIKEKLVSAILDADRELGNTILSKWAEEHGFEDTVHQLLDPSLEKIGTLWEKTSSISLAQVYIAGKISEDFLATAALQYASKEVFSHKGPVVIGNTEDDYHSLGRKMLDIFLKTAGWIIYDLGNDVSAETFVDEAVEKGAKIIGVSAMMYTTAINIKKIREELDSRGLSGKIKLLVGGAVFKLRPELVAEVGGDGTASNAITAVELFEATMAELEGDK